MNAENGSIIDIENIDAEIKRVKNEIAELENPERALKFARARLDFLEATRKCRSEKKLAR